MRAPLAVLASACIAFTSFACENVGSPAAAGTDPGASPDGSAGGDGGRGGGRDGGVAGDGTALPPSTFLFERKVSADESHLMAFDLATGEERLVTDLRGDESDGWGIDGFSISPDRTRIVLASLYGPTKEDVDTGLATQRLWTLDIHGGDFTRLTPVFKNTGGGQSGWRIDVRDPTFSNDGASVIYDYGEGTFSSSYSRPWIISTAGGTFPSEVPTKAPSCPVVTGAAVRPNTGELLLHHLACLTGADNGLFLYPDATSGGAPELLVPEGALSIDTTTPQWAADGSLFVFSTDHNNVRSLYAYDMKGKQAVALVEGTAERDIVSGVVSLDGNYLVYCVREGEAENLHVIDFSVEPPTDTPLTSDGASCSPAF